MLGASFEGEGAWKGVGNREGCWDYFLRKMKYVPYHHTSLRDLNVVVVFS